MKKVCPASGCIYDLESLDIPATRNGRANLFQCNGKNCGNVYRENTSGEMEVVTHLFERIALGDDRFRSAVSGGHEVLVSSVLEAITSWRAATEMDTLAMIGQVQQRLGVLDNRLHSLKKRLAESLLGEPIPMDTEQMLRLVDECIDLVSPTPRKQRGVRGQD